MVHKHKCVFSLVKFGYAHPTLYQDCYILCETNTTYYTLYIVHYLLYYSIIYILIIAL